ncbi:diaminopimelate epimerase [Lysobacter sp. H23M47]|uniref:diaminopimelate epimerase n=1 Tax=Lysobacter sp. H23M47 TaxID=2781024 RepID=UPI0018815611|nr:diaminopimelate epimerase [Lysobacter sp. H23M47]QOW24346.1 diaminopimelate epimerase [Lysobacter sp. H23M47]
MTEAARTGSSSALPFSKMHGAGNDFVVLDLRGDRHAPEPDLCRAIAHRHHGVGCDQILTIEAPRTAAAIASYRIWNADGSTSQQCGNGARCVAAWLVRDGSAPASGDFQLDSPIGAHTVHRLQDGRYRVDMGVPEFEPARIPMEGFDAPRDPYVLPVRGSIMPVGAVSMGNPHALIEVEDIDAADMEMAGPGLQDHPAFPESVNVGFAQILGRDRIRLRVYERGVGETLACGSGACAAVAILARRGLVDRDVQVSLPGGDLQISWPADDQPVVMTGAAEFVFEGEWNA